MKKYALIYALMIAIIALTSFFAAGLQTGNVLIIKLLYDDGAIKYKDKIIKCGYNPDYGLQPGEGYTAELRDFDDKALYSFKFEVPLKVNFDISDPLFKTLSGGAVYLNETEFTIVFPYFEQTKSVVVYNPKKEKVLEIPMIEEQFVKKKDQLWWLLILAVIAAISHYEYNRLSKKKKG